MRVQQTVELNKSNDRCCNEISSRISPHCLHNNIKSIRNENLVIFFKGLIFLLRFLYVFIISRKKRLVFFYNNLIVNDNYSIL